MSTNHPGKTLARFAADLSLAAIPAPVLHRAEDLMLDWLNGVRHSARSHAARPHQEWLERVSGRDAACSTLASLAVEDGKPGPQKS